MMVNCNYEKVVELCKNHKLEPTADDVMRWANVDEVEAFEILIKMRKNGLIGVSEIDHEFTDEIVCPHCGYEYPASWEFTLDVDEETCAECGGQFSYERITSTYYNTEKVGKENE
ncbi:MAG: hypothetical protein ACK5LJ_17645 [Paracoccus sp. (in: a-proteobacteria)]